MAILHTPGTTIPAMLKQPKQTVAMRAIAVKENMMATVPMQATEAAMEVTTRPTAKWGTTITA